jgi:hypothetical protein
VSDSPLLYEATHYQESENPSEDIQPLAFHRRSLIGSPVIETRWGWTSINVRRKTLPLNQPIWRICRVAAVVQRLPVIKLLKINDLKAMVPKKGLEPPHPCGYMDLNHARLPIPPLRHEGPAQITLDGSNS